MNKLTREQSRVLKEKGTEPAGSGKLLHNKTSGAYHCAQCGTLLFKSETKFDSGSGWPSFYDVVKENIKLEEDNSMGIQRTEVICKKCGGHLGHLFNDAPQTPTGNRYCINSLTLDFKKTKKFTS